MRAILVAANNFSGESLIDERIPRSLFLAADRPFIHHVVESLVQQGINKIDFIFCNMPEKFGHELGNGERWGCSFEFHLAKTPQHPYNVIHTFDLGEDETVLFGHANRLPNFDLKNLHIQPTLKMPVLFHYTQSEEQQAHSLSTWTGWAVKLQRDG